jgi:Cu-Zn family superoxide dismutase
MKRLVALSAWLAVTAISHAAETRITVNAVSDASGVGSSIGTIRLTDTPEGLLLTPALTGQSPGAHGMHIHENPSCASGAQNGASVAALGAGGHLDPQATKHHAGPAGDGHLGDLPALEVATDGSASSAVLAPRLKLADVMQRALVVHAGGDNFSDAPNPLGGGGARVACGVIAG